MADTTVALAEDAACYDLGRANWDPPWVPDLAQPGCTIPLAEDRVIDLVVLGDGYEQRTEFETALQDWLADLFAVEVYERFRGAFRIRGIFIRSAHPASEDRTSYFHVKIASGSVSRDGWWRGGGALNREFRRRLFCALDLLPLNRARYPAGLNVGGAKTVIHNTLGRMYSHLVVCLLVRTGPGTTASGLTRDVPAPDGARLNVAFGSYSLHELGHAFAYLEDEYISRRRSQANRTNPSRRSLFTLSNLSFSPRLSEALWLHLSPWGTVPRQAAGADPSPLVGWLWRGGEQDRKVWHAEYECLMNGRHNNYAFTSDEPDDPTANPDGSYTDGQGASLRARHRYCLWCQEIVLARILEKTGRLAAPGDPSNINTRGRVWYDRWISTWRGRYWSVFDVPLRIQQREAYYANAGNFPLLASNGLELWRSDLYQPFGATPVSTAPATGDPLDGEWLLLAS